MVCGFAAAEHCCRPAGSDVVDRLMVAGVCFGCPVAISIMYTLFGLVQINNRVSSWDLEALPSDWREQRRQWDRLHRFRVILLGAALISLVTSTVLEHSGQAVLPLGLTPRPSHTLAKDCE